MEDSKIMREERKVYSRQGRARDKEEASDKLENEVVNVDEIESSKILLGKATTRSPCYQEYLRDNDHLDEIPKDNIRTACKHDKLSTTHFTRLSRSDSSSPKDQSKSFRLKTSERYVILI